MSGLNVGQFVYLLLKIVFCGYAINVLREYRDDDIGTMPKVAMAFLVYSIPYFLEMINYVFYGGVSKEVQVMQYPFPLIATMMFARIVYLKLVDKATIKSELEESKKLYYHEKGLGEMKDEFIGTMSHELKTPLTSMQLYTALLEQKKFGEITKEQSEALKIIGEENKRLTRMINDVLELSRMENKNFVIKKSPVNIMKLCQDPLYENMVKSKGLDYVIDSQKNFFVMIDEEKFKQVFINLLSNAIKFTEKGSITIIVKEYKKVWTFTIKDTGMGIPKKSINLLFNKFYQVGGGMTREKSRGGTGLGLVIVKKIVEAHKGRIRIDSEVNKGTSIRILFMK